MYDWHKKLAPKRSVRELSEEHEQSTSSAPPQARIECDDQYDWEKEWIRSIFTTLERLRWVQNHGETG